MILSTREPEEGQLDSRQSFMLAFIRLLSFLYAAPYSPLFYPALDSFTYQTFTECLVTQSDTRDIKLTKAQSCPEGYYSPVGEIDGHR